jgi:uncharacterized protein (TIRG00374 family)
VSALDHVRATAQGLGDGEACPPGEKTPSWLTWVTRVSVVIGIGALIATVYFVGPYVILDRLRAIGWFFVLLVGLEIVSSVFDATAIYYMADGPGRPSWRKSVVAQIVGRGVNSVTPGGNLGEVLKVGLLSQRCSPKRIVAAVMYVNLMRVVMQLSVVAIGVVATAFLFDVPPAVMLLLIVGGVVSAGIAVAIVYLMRRGMLSTLSNALAHVHLISKKRRQSWTKTLEEVDTRLRGHDNQHRTKALIYIGISQLLEKGLTYLTIFAAGYLLGPGQFLALLSAGVLLGWISTIIPMGLGISEGGNVALFTLIGAPAPLGLALALARRVNQIVFAAIGFAVLTADRAADRVASRAQTRWSSRQPVVKAS